MRMPLFQLLQPQARVGQLEDHLVFVAKVDPGPSDVGGRRRKRSSARNIALADPGGKLVNMSLQEICGFRHVTRSSYSWRQKASKSGAACRLGSCPASECQAVTALCVMSERQKANRHTG